MHQHSHIHKMSQTLSTPSTLDLIFHLDPKHRHVEGRSESPRPHATFRPIPGGPGKTCLHIRTSASSFSGSLESMWDWQRTFQNPAAAPWPLTRSGMHAWDFLLGTPSFQPPGCGQGCQLHLPTSLLGSQSSTEPLRGPQTVPCLGHHR